MKGHDGSKGGTRVLILASEIDEVFCAGADLRERKAMSIEEYVGPCILWDSNCISVKSSVVIGDDLVSSGCLTTSLPSMLC